MRNTWLVFRHEVRTNLARTSFVVLAFGVPLLVIVILAALALLRGGNATPSSGSPIPTPTPVALRTEGVVDHSGIVRAIPADLASTLKLLPDEAAAQRALQIGEVSAYYVVPTDYLQTGDLLYINPSMQGFSFSGQAWMMRRTLLVNVLNGDEALALRLQEPLHLQEHPLAPQRASGPTEGAAYWMPYAACMLLYMAIILSSGLLRSSTGNERKNRVLEVLITSTDPLHLLVGKVTGLGVLGLLQTTAWGLMGLAVMRLGGRAFQWTALPTVPLTLLVWVVVFFVLGYAIYATLLAGVGALTGPNMPGASASDIVIIWPLIIPIAFWSLMVMEPNGLIAVVLSLFPLTAPVAMVTRLAVGNIPLWQPLLAVALTLLTALAVVHGVTRVFRAQVLLSGQPFSVRRYLAIIVGRA